MSIKRRVIPILAALVLAGCAARAPELADINPFPPPPPDRMEARPLPPVSEDELIWQPGHWDWTGSAYAWTSGRWTPRGTHSPNWRMGGWARSNGVWVWVPGGWV